MTPVDAIYLYGIITGVLLANAIRSVAWLWRRWRDRRRTRAASLPPPDTIEYRNARAIAEWARRRAERLIRGED